MRSHILNTEHIFYDKSVYFTYMYYNLKNLPMENTVVKVIAGTES